MKKLILVGTLLVTSFFTVGFNVGSVKAAEDSDVMDPVVANDGPEDGVNDQSSVQLKVRKISNDFDLITPMGAGEWDYLGSSTFYRQSKTFYSGGGDLGIQIKQPYIGPGFTWRYKLVEEDPIFNDDVSYFTLSNQGGTYEVIFNVRSFVDGNNKKAELHLEKLTNPATKVSTKWWD
ncbi:hypothetical protein [Bacillus sp. NPDC093026]|uniref:hypothetical protein n=1 Tax=Bacillus sp. NPDC093026 TaxID=3363948 RepID=UPI0037F560BB